MKNLSPTDASALEAVETREWIDSLDYVLQQGDKGRTLRLLDALKLRARQAGVKQPFTSRTPYMNTIPAQAEVPIPGDRAIERRIKSLARWNALAMVVARQPRVGGHRRSHLDLRVGGHAVRGGLQPLLPRQGRRPRRRRRVLPGACVAGHLRPRLPRGPLHRAAPPRLPARAAARAAACRRTRTRG